MHLDAGRGVVFQLRGGGGAFFTLALYAPGTSTIEASSPIARTDTGTASPRLTVTAPSAGTYYLVVGADSGDGSYTVSALADGDRDGVPNKNDNCPASSNPGQTDWNKNGRGDACDRASRTTLSRLVVRGHTLTATGNVRPDDASPTAWIVEVRRGKKLVARGRGGGRKGAGRAVAVIKVPAGVHGRVRVRAVLTDRRFNRAISKTLTATLR